MCLVHRTYILEHSSVIRERCKCLIGGEIHGLKFCETVIWKKSQVTTKCGAVVSITNSKGFSLREAFPEHRVSGVSREGESG